MNRLSRLFAGFLICAAAYAAAIPAQAVGITVRDCANVGSFNLTGLAILRVNVGTGDVINAAGAGGAVEVSINGGQPSTPLLPFSVTAVVDGQIELNHSGTDAVITCTPKPTATAPANVPTTLGNTLGVLSGNSQTTATQVGINKNTQNRLGGGGANTVTRNDLFFSTQGAPGQVGRSDYNAWVFAEGRFYSGAVTGFSGDLVGGMDFQLNPRTIVGALAAYNYMDLSTAATQAIVNAPAFGGYFATRLDTNLYLDGYLSVAFPNYTVPGATFSATRYSTSLNLTGEIERGVYRLEPFAQFKGFTEAQPAFTGTTGATGANNISSYTLSTGARLTATANEGTGGIVPYVSVALDYRSLTSTLTGVDTFLAPRLGVGGTMELGGGALSLDLDTGRVRSDTTDIGGRLTYEFAF